MQHSSSLVEMDVLKAFKGHSFRCATHLKIDSLERAVEAFSAIYLSSSRKSCL
jgi:hypothetical protein